MKSTTVPSPEAMMALGASYASSARSGDVFALVGTFGAGKTHWTKGFVRALNPETNATSPTFGIVNEYHLDSNAVFHFDFYRLESSSELLSLGWDEYLEEAGIVICEWADLFADLMPENTKWLHFTHREDGSRTVEETPRPDKARNLEPA